MRALNHFLDFFVTCQYIDWHSRIALEVKGSFSNTYKKLVFLNIT